MPFSDKHADVNPSDHNGVKRLDANGKPIQKKVIEGRRLMPVGEFIFYRDPTKEPKVEEKFHKETFRKFLEMRRNFVKNLDIESFFYEILVQNRILRLRTEEN